MQLKLLNGVILKKICNESREEQELIKLSRGQEFSSWFKDDKGEKRLFLKYRWGKSHNHGCDDCGFIDLNNYVFSIFDGVTNVNGKPLGFGGKEAFDIASYMEHFTHDLLYYRDFTKAIASLINRFGRKKTTAVILWLDEKEKKFYAFSVGDSKFLISIGGDVIIENDDSLIFDEEGSALVFGDNLAHSFYTGETREGLTLYMFTDGQLNDEDDLIYLEYEL